MGILMGEVMGFIHDLLGLNREGIVECWPGGKALQVHIELDKNKGRFTYFGRYGLRCKFQPQEVDHISINEISNTHGLVQIFSRDACLATLDPMPYDACHATKEWVEQFLGV